ncbi:hypothetical protein FO519_009127 [Halicephalobus sp. NKZ332]|nr:hypothetical protein FO519_009127 [Halicephalobus sp. NKZ332]
MNRNPTVGDAINPIRDILSIHQIVSIGTFGACAVFMAKRFVTKATVIAIAEKMTETTAAATVTVTLPSVLVAGAVVIVGIGAAMVVKKIIVNVIEMERRSNETSRSLELWREQQYEQIAIRHKERMKEWEEEDRREAERQVANAKKNQENFLRLYSEDKAKRDLAEKKRRKKEDQRLKAEEESRLAKEKINQEYEEVVKELERRLKEVKMERTRTTNDLLDFNLPENPLIYNDKVTSVDKKDNEQKIQQVDQNELQGPIKQKDLFSIFKRNHPQQNQNQGQPPKRQTQLTQHMAINWNYEPVKLPINFSYTSIGFLNNPYDGLLHALLGHGADFARGQHLPPGIQGIDYNRFQTLINQIKQMNTDVQTALNANAQLRTQLENIQKEFARLLEKLMANCPYLGVGYDADNDTHILFFDLGNGDVLKVVMTNQKWDPLLHDPKRAVRFLITAFRITQNKYKNDALKLSLNPPHGNPGPFEQARAQAKLEKANNENARKKAEQQKNGCAITENLLGNQAILDSVRQRQHKGSITHGTPFVVVDDDDWVYDVSNYESQVDSNDLKRRANNGKMMYWNFVVTSLMTTRIMNKSVAYVNNAFEGLLHILVCHGKDFDKSRIPQNTALERDGIDYQRFEDICRKQLDLEKIQLMCNSDKDIRQELLKMQSTLSTTLCSLADHFSEHFIGIGFDKENDYQILCWKIGRDAPWRKNEERQIVAEKVLKIVFTNDKYEPIPHEFPHYGERKLIQNNYALLEFDSGIQKLIKKHLTTSKPHQYYVKRLITAFTQDWNEFEKNDLNTLILFPYYDNELKF